MTNLSRLDVIGLFAFSMLLLLLPATSWAQQRPPIAEQGAKTFGLDSFGQIEGIRYTFNPERPDGELSRRWEWNPKTDTVSYERKDKEGKPVKVTYQRSQLGSQSDAIKNEIDPAFLNDQYWLLFPFHVVWDSSATVTDEGMQKMPIGNASAERVVVKYPSEGGYSEGDTWELYVGADKRVEEMIYHRGGTRKPSVVIATWADYKKAGPLPLAAEPLPEELACYGARGRCREGAGQRMRSFRQLGIDRRHVQDRHQSSVDVENGCSGTAQVDVPRSEMLSSVDRDRPLLGDAGADAVGAFDRLGPHAAEPSPPVSEAARIGIVAAVFDCDAGGVAEQDGVSGLANHPVESIDLLLRTEDELVERFTKILELVRQKDARRLAIEGIDAMLGRRPPPRSRYWLDADRGRVALRNRIDVLSMLCGRVARACGAYRARHSAPRPLKAERSGARASASYRS